jgi:hypothetical protein
VEGTHPQSEWHEIARILWHFGSRLINHLAKTNPLLADPSQRRSARDAALALGWCRLLGVSRWSGHVSGGSIFLQLSTFHFSDFCDRFCALDQMVALDLLMICEWPQIQRHFIHVFCHNPIDPTPCFLPTSLGREKLFCLQFGCSACDHMHVLELGLV